ncbi:unnamed protein product, partial [Gulo gulo]
MLFPWMIESQIVHQPGWSYSANKQLSWDSHPAMGLQAWLLTPISLAAVITEEFK